MDEFKIREIIREELSNIIKFDRITINKLMQFMDGRNIQIGRSTGTIIGTEGGATGQKLGFFGTTPVIQPSAISDPAGGATEDSEARAAINAIIDALQSLGLLDT